MKRYFLILALFVLVIGCENAKVECYKCTTRIIPILDSMWITARFCNKVDTICDTKEEIVLHEQTNTFENWYIVKVYDLTHYYETGDTRITPEMGKDSTILIQTKCNCEKIVE